MNDPKVQEAREFYTHRHDVYVNQKYGKGDILPYSFHLGSVYKFELKFLHLIEDESDQVAVLIAAWGHDSEEDGRLTYNDNKNRFGAKAADIIHCCTDEKGKDRETRKPVKYYKELGENELAVYTKLCDMMANITFGLSQNSSMYKKYKKEWATGKMKKYAYVERWKPMFDFIDWLFTNPTV